LASQYSAHDRQTAGNVALIADDDPNVLDVLRPILTEANYKVVIASGARQALEIAPQVDASVVIVDLSVADGVGLETCAALRRLPNWRDVPMLILTSYQTDKALRAAGTPGISDFLCKPFVPSELLRRVARAIGEQPGPRASERMVSHRVAPGDAHPGDARAIKARRTRKPVTTDNGDRFEHRQRPRQTNDDVAQPRAKAAPWRDTDDEPPSPLRVLVADDDELTRHVVTHILGHEGYLAHGVTDGREAVAAVIHGNYDLVLMDVRMPVLGGSEATRLIRALPTPKRFVPVIAMTTTNFTAFTRELINAGMNDYLMKPIRPDSLLACMREHLAPEHSGEELQILEFDRLEAEVERSGLGAVNQLFDSLAEAINAIVPVVQGWMPSRPNEFVAALHALSDAAKPLACRALADAARSLGRDPSPSEVMRKRFVETARATLVAIRRFREKSAVANVG